MGGEAARERRMHRQELTLLSAPGFRRDLGGSPRAHLRAEEHRLECGLHPCDCDARDP